MDANKAALNLSNHRVSFPEAMSVFGDPLESMIPMIPDPALGRLRRRSGESMSQEVNSELDEDILPEYDFAHRCKREASRSLQGGNQCDFS